jgi:hypothetical protein
MRKKKLLPKKFKAKKIVKLSHLKDSYLKNIVPMFVESNNSTADHKCGTCLFRVGKNQCAIMKGPISFANGTCAFWAKGPESSKVNETRLTKQGAGYVEVRAGQKINCGSCIYYGAGICKIWSASVHKGDCCMVWKGKN